MNRIYKWMTEEGGDPRARVYASWFSTKATDFNIEAMIRGYDSIKEVLIEINNKGFE